MTLLQTQRWKAETREVLERAREVLTKSTSPSIRNLADELPAEQSDSDNTISLVFAGQYSAGKSSLIRALTGRDDIVTGSGITTDRVHHYEWHGITITDTPGIHTSIRPDHDATSYAAISQADLLVFVITNELFDSHIAENYRRLTIDHERVYESILVVNKMNRHRLGNTPESRAIVTEALRPALQPFTPEQLRVTFTDAASALQAEEEDGQALVAFLRNEGNISQLAENLDALARDQGLNSRQTTALYQATQVLAQAIAEESTDDPTGDALNLVYNQNAKAITQAITTVRQETGVQILDAKRAIINAGHDLADSVHEDSSQEDIEDSAQNAERLVQATVEELDRNIYGVITRELPELAASMARMQTENLHQDGSGRIAQEATASGRAARLDIIRAITAQLADTAGRLARNSTAATSGARGLAQFSGSTAHSTILTLGRTFGHSFRPWEAVKFARAVGRASVILTVGTVALDLFLTVKEEQDRRRKEAEIRNTRQDLRANFAAVALQVEREATSVVDQTIAELLEEPLQAIREEQANLNTARQERNEQLRQLNEVYASANALIHQIHEEQLAKSG